MIDNKQSFSLLFERKILPCALECSFWEVYGQIHWRSQGAEKVMLIKGRLLDQSVILFNCAPFSKWELLLKERICSLGANSFS